MLGEPSMLPSAAVIGRRSARFSSPTPAENQAVYFKPIGPLSDAMKPFAPSTVAQAHPMPAAPTAQARPLHLVVASVKTSAPLDLGREAADILAASGALDDYFLRFVDELDVDSELDDIFEMTAHVAA
jgi:hypothetical protein